MTATPQRAFLLYFPAFATFYFCDDLIDAETIIASHWGVAGEVRDRAGNVIVTQACHDVAAINAARDACHRLGLLERCRSEFGFICV